jgi:hypothetical protein
MHSVTHRCRLLLVLLTLLLNACAFPIDQADQRLVQAEKLAAEIMALSPVIQRQEAYDFALAAVETSAALGKKYEVRLRPWLHNGSILLGLKERGLCYEYAADLYTSLKTVKTVHLRLLYVAANQGKLNEHHAVTVIAQDAPWNSGLILDAWRRNGNLHFGPLQQDSYPWIRDGAAGAADIPAVR